MIEVHAANCWGFVTAVWEKGGIVTEVISWIFFRALALISPLFTLLETIWCHGVTVYHRFMGHELRDEIGSLQAQSRTLNETIRSMTIDAERSRVAIDRLNWESAQVNDERTTACRERDAEIEGKAALTRQRNQLQTQNTELNKKVETLKEQQQNVELLNAELLSLRQQLVQAQEHNHLSDQLTRVDEAFDQYGPQGTQTLRELETLLPFLSAQKEKYREMLRSCKQTLPPDAGIAIDGLIEINEAESTHLVHLSKLIQLHKNLQNDELCRAAALATAPYQSL